MCGVSFLSHKLFKLGGAFLIAAGKCVYEWNSEAQSGHRASLRCSWLLGEQVDTNTAAAAAAAADSCSYLSRDRVLAVMFPCRSAASAVRVGDLGAS